MKYMNDEEISFMVDNPDKTISYLRQKLREVTSDKERDELTASLLSVITSKLMMPIIRFIVGFNKVVAKTDGERRSVIAMFSSGIIFASSKSEEDAWAIFEIARKQLQASSSEIGYKEK